VGHYAARNRPRGGIMLFIVAGFQLKTET